MPYVALLLLTLSGLVAAGCSAEPPPPRATQESASAEEVVATPWWSDPLARVDLVARAADWRLEAQPEAGGVIGVEIDAGDACTGHVHRARVPVTPAADRSKALEKRILGRVDALGVQGAVIRDRGEVPHGDFRAHMVRLDGTLDGRPWASRITGTFVTRQSGRFYVEVAAVSHAPGFVARRGCFDTLTAAVTIYSERR